MELKWEEAFLGPYDYGRRHEVFSFNPGNQASATISIISGKTPITGVDNASIANNIHTVHAMAKRYADPMQIASSMTISRVDLNASIAYHRRHFTLTREIKQAYLDEGIDID